MEIWQLDGVCDGRRVYAGSNKAKKPRQATLTWMSLAFWIGIFRWRWHSVESGGWSGLVSEGRGTVGSVVVSSSLRSLLVNDMPVGGFRCQRRRRLCHWCWGKLLQDTPASGSHDQPRLPLATHVCAVKFKPWRACPPHATLLLSKCEMAGSYFPPSRISSRGGLVHQFVAQTGSVRICDMSQIFHFFPSHLVALFTSNTIIILTHTDNRCSRFGIAGYSSHLC